MTTSECDGPRCQSGPAKGAQTLQSPELTALQHDEDIRGSYLVDGGADSHLSRSCAITGAAGGNRSRRRRWWTTGETEVLCLGDYARAE